MADLRWPHSEIAERWMAMTRDVKIRGAWGDPVIDALCGPPESFPLTQIIAHDPTVSAHRPTSLTLDVGVGQHRHHTPRSESDHVDRRASGGLP